MNGLAISRLPQTMSILIVTLACLGASALGQSERGTSASREASAALEIRWKAGAGGDWKRGPAEVVKGQAAALRVEPIAGASIRWYQIAPDTRKYYKNANFPWEPNAYKWVGYGKVEFLRREMTGWRDRWEVALPNGGPRGVIAPELAWTDAGRFYHSDFGSFWFEAEVRSGDRVSRTPGLAAMTDRGLSPSVFRLSVRQDNSLPGWITSFFNVPGLFGCTPWQSANYIGVDCADCMMAACARWKSQPLTKDWNVAGVVSAGPRVKEFDITKGAPAIPIRWGVDIRPGDLIAVRFTNARQYQHIGAMYADANNDGKLDATDLVIHAGPAALQISPLSDGNFDGHVAIVRPARP
jgi:hypothetical protein